LPQRRRQMQRLRRLFLRAPLLDAIPGGVLRVLGSPVRLRLLPPRRLTLRPATGALPRSYSWVGTEPMVADGTRSLPGRWHRESSSPCCCLGFRWRFSSDCLGNFSKAHLGNFSRAPKRLSLRDGWRMVVQEGSHRQYKHPIKKGRVTIAGHPSMDLDPKTKSSILSTSVIASRIFISQLTPIYSPEWYFCLCKRPRFTRTAPTTRG